jgi:hypothetical protein
MVPDIAGLPEDCAKAAGIVVTQDGCVVKYQIDVIVLFGRFRPSQYT